MSYDLSLVDKEGQSLPLETSHEGGTMPLGGYTTTDFNITYNYSWFYYRYLDKNEGLRWLYKKTGRKTIKRLEKAINELGITKYNDYWAPTPGNARAALVPLLEAAKQYPDAIWDGD